MAASFSRVPNIRRRKAALPALLIGLSVLLVTYLHYTTTYTNQPLHSIYAELHYIPLLLAGLVFGLRGAALTSVLVSLLYGAYLVQGWPGASLRVLDNSIHIVFPALFALLIGFLVDRERRRRRQFEKNRYLSGLGQANAVLVHDLRNPLLVIQAAIKRVRNGRAGCEELAGEVSRAAERMEWIMDRTLEFARPLQLDMTNADACAMIRDVGRAILPKAEEVGVRLIVDVPEEPLPVPMDVAYLQRALVNLVNNAIEASDRDKEVLVRVRRKDEAAVIKIRDRGKGMDRETRENVFIPFYSKKGKGTGLGMAIAKKIIEEHRGQIGVESEPGVGTKVSIRLPLSRPAS